MIGAKIYKTEIQEYGWDSYHQLADFCNETQRAMIVDRGDYYECIERTTPNKALEEELAELEEWLSSHDYIGTKIATGRATIQDYAEEIALMRTKAERVDEIRSILNC